MNVGLAEADWGAGKFDGPAETVPRRAGRAWAAKEEDPPTGEVVDDHARLLDLHDRLEGAALEILTMCREIRRALAGSQWPDRPTLALFVPPEDRTVRMPGSS